MTLSAYNRLRIHNQRDHYVVASFVVTVIRTTPDMDNAEGVSTLEGTVNGQTEHMIPGGDRDRHILAASYPPGTILPVLYNPAETTAVIQDETLRVLPYDAGFWQREDSLRRSLTLMVFVPFPAAFLLYLLCRHLHSCAQKAGTLSAPGLPR
jgi:hypothetical protein